ncbi:hypothetical protein WJX72_000051 [[Myrmecia] bisecta]|uniref:Androgen receptor n=1 Tax=[Myrmecia] bisecta TaxID=41462 RepID=A0AAW1QDZ5_9CHLO
MQLRTVSAGAPVARRHPDPPHTWCWVQRESPTPYLVLGAEGDQDACEPPVLPLTPYLPPGMYGAHRQSEERFQSSDDVSPMRGSASAAGSLPALSAGVSGSQPYTDTHPPGASPHEAPSEVDGQTQATHETRGEWFARMSTGKAARDAAAAAQRQHCAPPGHPAVPAGLQPPAVQRAVWSPRGVQGHAGSQRRSFSAGPAYMQHLEELTIAGGVMHITQPGEEDGQNSVDDLHHQQQLQPNAESPTRTALCGSEQCAEHSPEWQHGNLSCAQPCSPHPAAAASMYRPPSPLGREQSAELHGATTAALYHAADADGHCAVSMAGQPPAAHLPLGLSGSLQALTSSSNSPGFPAFCDTYNTNTPDSSSTDSSSSSSSSTGAQADMSPLSSDPGLTQVSEPDSADEDRPFAPHNSGSQSRDEADGSCPLEPWASMQPGHDLASLWTQTSAAHAGAAEPAVATEQSHLGCPGLDATSIAGNGNGASVYVDAVVATARGGLGGRASLDADLKEVRHKLARLKIA